MKKKLSEIIERMDKVTESDNMSLDDLSQLVSISAKYVKCKGEMSGIGQMWTGITSPNMNFVDTKWFISQLNTKKFFDKNKKVMKYAFFDFDIAALSTIYDVPVYYLAGEDDFAVC